MRRPCSPFWGVSGILLQKPFSTRVSDLHPTFIQHFQNFLAHVPLRWLRTVHASPWDVSPEDAASLGLLSSVQQPG